MRSEISQPILGQLGNLEIEDEDLNIQDQELDNLIEYLRSEIDFTYWENMSYETELMTDETEIMTDVDMFYEAELMADEAELMADDNMIYEAILQYLRGNPPTSQSVIENLPSVIENLPSIVLTEDKMNILCVVCQDKISSHEAATQLPCLHKYHRQCICSWLSLRNSCPMCRYELPTDDLDYEKSKT